MKIGERIKARRKELGLSVDDVVKKLGVDRTTFYRYESSYIGKLPTKVLEPLAEVLKTTPATLMGWEDNNKRLKHEVPDELAELGVDWVVLVKKCKNSGLTPEQVEQVVDAIKNIK